VSFKYPGSSKYAIRDVTFSVPLDERVAIVGSNGAGKSTLVKLLCRLYDPDSGEVLLDGQDIRGYDPEEYRRSVAVVFQDFARYHFTARMNIGVGDIAHVGDLERVRSAAIASGADEFIRRWRDGYETDLGRLFGGVELSTGEWQKVAIARALMSGGRLLVLDEPAAALDPESEENLHQRLREAAHGRACLIISHRLAVVMDADRIVTMEQGRIVEEGTHAELLERSGRYSELFTLQAARYGYAPALALPLRKG
jgi:ATP-binding cassette subfamily B protein